MSMKVKDRVALDPSRGGRTRQSERDACDVNFIVAHHRRGGVSNHVVQRVAEYGFVPAVSFHECMNEARKGIEVFEALPAATRDYFNNDPKRFVEFVMVPESKAKLLELGLVLEREKPAPVLGSAENPIHTAPAAPGGSGTGPGGTPG